MHAKGTCRRRGCVLDVLRLSVPHHSLRGALSDTKGFNFPPSRHLHLHSSAGPLRCCSPRSTITLPLLNIYGSQETRSQQQLFCSHTFFLIVSPRAFTTLSFMVFLWGRGGFRDFFKVFTADQDWGGSVGPVGKATVPSCGRVRSLQRRSESLKDQDQIFVVLNMLLAVFFLSN